MKIGDERVFGFKTFRFFKNLQTKDPHLTFYN